jgi:hypothetical protein
MAPSPQVPSQSDGSTSQKNVQLGWPGVALLKPKSVHDIVDWSPSQTSSGSSTSLPHWAKQKLVSKPAQSSVQPRPNPLSYPKAVQSVPPRSEPSQVSPGSSRSPSHVAWHPLGSWLQLAVQPRPSGLEKP